MRTCDFVGIHVYLCTLQNLMFDVRLASSNKRWPLLWLSFIIIIFSCCRCCLLQCSSMYADECVFVHLCATSHHSTSHACVPTKQFSFWCNDTSRKLTEASFFSLYLLFTCLSSLQRTRYSNSARSIPFQFGVFHFFQGILFQVEIKHVSHIFIIIAVVSFLLLLFLLLLVADLKRGALLLTTAQCCWDFSYGTWELKMNAKWKRERARTEWSI